MNPCRKFLIILRRTGLFDKPALKISNIDCAEGHMKRFLEPRFSPGDDFLRKHRSSSVFIPESCFKDACYLNRPGNRSYAFSSFLAIFIALFICIAGTMTRAEAVPYKLTVTKGSGGGSYEPSSLVHISAFPYDTADPATSTSEPADASAPVRIFDRWTGDTTAVKDIWAKDTTLVMPSRNVTVTAQFKDVPRWKAPRIVSSFPANPVGIIYVFHGIGGGIADLLGSLEVTRFVDQAVSRNYAVVMIESYERKIGLWDVDHTRAVDNIDMARLAAVHNRLLAGRFILENDPVYFVGISQGAFFATIAAAEAGRGGLPFTVKAVASYISPGSRNALETTSTPTIFILARNDEIMNTSWASANYDLLVGRGIASQVWIQEPTPVLPDRFWGIPGLSGTDSLQLQNSLKENGMLDAQLFLKASAFEDNNRDGAPDWITAIPFGYTDFLIEIGSQLRIAHSAHAFFSNLNGKTFDFFQNPVTIVTLGPIITGFSPESGGTGTEVTVTGSNFVDVLTVTFNGMPAADFTVQDPTVLTATVPADATSGPVSITSSAGSAVSPGAFTVTTMPRISEFTPSWGSVGASVTISGTGLADTTTVRFGRTSASFSVLSDTAIRAVVPQGAETGRITVITSTGYDVSESRFWVWGGW